MPSTDFTTNGEARRPLPHRVYLRESLTSGSWTYEPDLDLISVVDGANAITQIVLRYHYGRILREGAALVTTVDPAVWIGHYVMVEVYQPDGTTVAQRWCGVIRFEKETPLGGDGTAELGPPTGDQEFLALGLETLLDETIVRGAYVHTQTPLKKGQADDDGEPMAMRTDTPIAFNERGPGWLRWMPNASVDRPSNLFDPSLGTDAETCKVPVPAQPESGLTADAQRAPVFGSDAIHTAYAGETWSILDVVVYLLAYYAPRVGSKMWRVDLLGGEAEGEAEGDAEKLRLFLRDCPLINYSAEGKSVFQCLNEIFRPERGFCWTLEYDNSFRNGTEAPIVRVTSINAVEVDIEIPEDPFTIGSEFPDDAPVEGPGLVREIAKPLLSASLDLSVRKDARWTMHRNAMNEYGIIEVLGEEVLSCFSVSHADRSLEMGWPYYYQERYDDPSEYVTGGDADYGLHQRILDWRARSRVWTEYHLPDDWDCRAGDGEGGGTMFLVNPMLNADGELDEASYWGQHRRRQFWRLESFIPVRWFHAGNPANVEQDAPIPEYESTMTFFKFNDEFDASGGWYDLLKNTRQDCPRIQVSTLPNKAGLRVVATPNHAIAGFKMFANGELTTEKAQPEDDPQVYETSWQQMIFTVAMRTGQRLFARAEVDNGIPDSHARRKLTIEVPGAERWMICPNTVFYVKGDRTLQRTHASNYTVVRDDHPMLRSVLSMAKAWYGQPKRNCTISFGSIAFDVPAAGGDDDPSSVHLANGLLVKSIVGGGDEAIGPSEYEDVSGLQAMTPITRRAFDFVNHVTHISTGFEITPDFSGLF